MCHGTSKAIQGVLHLKISIADVYEQLRQAGIILSTILILACFIIAVCLIIFLRHLIVDPLVEIGTTVTQVGQGNLDVKVDISRGDEIGMISEQINSMVRDLKEQNRQIHITQDVTIHAMAGLAETRDNETGAHIRRTQNYVRYLAIQLKSQAKFSADLTPEIIELLYKSAPLHDVGKVGVPDRILLKPGKLTDEEFAEMKKHTTYGHDAIKMAEKDLGTTSFLRIAREIAYTHHEKWDGSGYPQGFAGEDIPVSGRLMALADVYDALISKRVYKPPITHTKAVKIIKERKGNHFDPDIVDAFLKIESEFQKTAVEFADSEEDRQAALL
ncbi:MAG: HD domain-containing protein [Deltaproteobacteria bacterium]|nr:HD domain-containing protein [Deltaproteobacteria bacterium]